MTFQTDAIDMNNPANKKFFTEQMNSSISSTINFMVNIELRDCAVGEKFTDSG